MDQWSREYEKGVYNMECIELNNRTTPRAILTTIEQYYEKPIRDILSQTYHIDLRSSTTISKAHKMSAKDDVILMHNDFRKTSRDFRACVVFNPKQLPQQGGVMVLFDKDNRDKLDPNHAYYPAEAGLCIGFEATQDSYHAVTPINAGKRYTLCFLFRVEIY